HPPAEERHVVPAESLVSFGQTVLEPVQLSAASHAPAAERQTVVAKVQLAVQHEPAAPLDAPRSHCSLNGVPDCTMPSPQYRSGLTDQPAFGRLSSRIFPLNVSGYAVADAPPAPWKPMVALCPFAPLLIVLRYCTFISFDRSWIC